MQNEPSRGNLWTGQSMSNLDDEIKKAQRALDLLREERGARWPLCDKITIEFDIAGDEIRGTSAKERDVVMDKLHDKVCKLVSNYMPEPIEENKIFKSKLVTARRAIKALKKQLAKVK